jgi:CRISPR/Cas system CMR-associated protein Cmr5 small subunit
MNTKNTGKHRVSIIVLIANVLLLTACAGQQAAQELAGLEVSTMMEYKQVINDSVSGEERYYKKVKEHLSNGLKKMKDEGDYENMLNRQAIIYDALWHKNPPSQHDVLTMIDTVYPDYEKIDTALNGHLKQLDEQYFSKVEKLTLQQESINKSIGALTKLYADDELNDQANLIKDRMLDTAKTVRSLTETKK